MEPVRTPLTEVDYVGSDDILPLPAHFDSDGYSCSVWEFTEEERKALADGGKVMLTVCSMGAPPPVSLTVVGPSCRVGGTERLMGWSERLQCWSASVDE